MKTLATSFFFALAFGAITFASSLSASAGLPKQPRRAVAYQVGIYGSADGTRLNVAVDKQSGGRVEVVLRDAKGDILFHQSLRSADSAYRGKLDVSSLTTGQYQLEVSNGQETTVRLLTILTQEPAAAARTIALL